MIRAADVAVLLVDLGSDDGLEQLQELLDRLNETKTRLDKRSHLDENDVGLSYTQTLLAPNKIDLSDARDRLQLLHEQLTAGGLAAAGRPRGGDEEVDVVGVVAFGLRGVHATHHRRPSHSAQYGHPDTTA